MREKLALVAAGAVLALAAAAAMPEAQAAVPWGAGCTSVAPDGTRTSATCGAELAAGRAIAPPHAPAGVAGPRWHRASVDSEDFVGRRPPGL